MINISVKNLSIKYGQRLLFSPISFRVISGEMLLIQGANGSGKSSLLKLLCGFATPNTGAICFQGQSISTSLFDYRQNIYYLGHINSLKLGLSVGENVQLAHHLYLGNQLPQSESDLWLKRFMLADFKETPVRLLSAGQKRKLALLNCCLIQKPVWILDEPLTSLDAEFQHFFLAELNSHLNAGGLALISTHDRAPFLKKNLKATHCVELKSC